MDGVSEHSNVLKRFPIVCPRRSSSYDAASVEQHRVIEHHKSGLPMEFETRLDIQCLDQALSLFGSSDNIGIVRLSKIRLRQDLVTKQRLGQAFDPVL